MQEVAPAVEYVPALQFRQTAEDVEEIDAEYVPPTQFMQVAAPADEYVPPTQLRQRVADACKSALVPASARYVPAAQFKHETDAAEVEYVPARHTSHEHFEDAL